LWPQTPFTRSTDPDSVVGVAGCMS
jgi:hypothetical protein